MDGFDNSCAQDLAAMPSASALRVVEASRGVATAAGLAAGGRRVERSAPSAARDAPARLDGRLTHEANDDPDGGQIFMPRGDAACVGLPAPRVDDVRPEAPRASRFDRTPGAPVDPGARHQPALPVGDEAELDDARGRVRARVSVDFVGELGADVAVSRPVRP